MTANAFVEGVAQLSRGIDMPAAKQLHRDALDWLREPWGTPERAVEVLTEGIRVLIADRAEGIGGLVALCIEAVAAGVIVDERHAEFFAGCNPARN